MTRRDGIAIKRLEVFANHGVLPEETALGQKFVVSAALAFDMGPAARGDDIERTINYAEVCEFITRRMKDCPRLLIETAADELAGELLARWQLLDAVELEIEKPWAPIGLPLESVAVRVTRERRRFCLSLGSNIGDRKGYIDGALRALGDTPGCRVERVSSYLETEPWGGVEQGDFLNACAVVSSPMTPREMLDRLHEIEAAAGRERLIKWGPRTLDIDIILCGAEIIDEPDLIVPHPLMHERDFVLRPLAEIAPGAVHPVLGRTVAMLAREFAGEG